MSATAAAERTRALGRAGVAACALLTRVPLPRGLTLDARDLARGAGLFPLVGATLGALVGGAATALASAGAPPLLAGAAGVLVAVLATGALHLDGLADAADALGGRSAPDALRIMRDHTLGTYGTTALILDLLLKASALGTLAAHGHAILAAAIAAALARAAGAVAAATMPYARADDASVAAGFIAAAGRGPAAAALLLAVAIAAAGAATGAAEAVAVALAALLTARTAKRRIGGVTGDVLGAIVETAETAALVAAAVAL